MYPLTLLLLFHSWGGLTSEGGRGTNKFKGTHGHPTLRRGYGRASYSALADPEETDICIHGVRAQWAHTGKGLSQQNTQGRSHTGQRGRPYRRKPIAHTIAGRLTPPQGMATSMHHAWDMLLESNAGSICAGRVMAALHRPGENLKRCS